MNLKNLRESLPVQILCLDKRQDLWTKLIQEVKEKISPNVYPFLTGDGELFPVRQYDKINWGQHLMGNWGYGHSECGWRHWNAFISHQMIIQRAKDNKWPYFLLLEDDAYITERFSLVWPVISDLCPENADLVYLGWWLGDENDSWNLSLENKFYEENECGLVRAKMLGGMHGIIINESMYDTLLDFKPVNPMDHQINQIQDKIQSYFVFPKIIHVVSTYSYCEGAVFTRNHL